MSDYPIKLDAIPVSQSIGTFYVCVVRAEILLEVCFSQRLQAVRTRDDRYRLEGTQRQLMERRLAEIASYIDTPESAFPNSIILAANVRPDASGDEMPENDGDQSDWRIEVNEGRTSLLIPSGAKLAAVIDGQHRLFAYSYAQGHLKDELVCSVFFDLPKPVQAYLFATINSKQRPVDKSQTYELFGYNLDEVPQERWDPDKLGVYIARLLNSENDSAVKGHITIAASNDIVRSKKEAREAGHWLVSLATFVQGTVRLISSNASMDGEALHRSARSDRRVLLEVPRDDRSVFRDLYLEGNDAPIYHVVKNFFNAASHVLFSVAPPRSFINRTVGIQALFDVLQKLIEQYRQDGDLSEEFFREKLSSAAAIDFGDDFFQASGKGRTRIRNTLLMAIGLPPGIIKDAADQGTYQRILDQRAQPI